MLRVTRHNWKISKGVLRYLNRPKREGIFYGGEWKIIGYTDSEWTGAQTRKSAGGLAFKIGNGVFSWKSKLQSVVAASTLEAEYINLFLKALKKLFGWENW